jgi:polyisoprenyl-phosphate glycosyltransferase
MINYSVVVPCFNEAENLDELLRRFSVFMNDGTAELILVDNGSTDATPELKNELLQKFSFLKWVSIEENIGYGHGILQGLLKAEGKYTAYSHADLQTDPNDVFRGMQILNQLGLPCVFIKGVRKGRGLVARFFSRGMEIVVAAILGVKMFEINSQPVFFDRQLLEDLVKPPVHWGFDLYVYYIALKRNYRMQRIDVEFPERKAGKSKWNEGFLSRIKLAVVMIKYCFEIKKDENNQS